MEKEAQITREHCIRGERREREPASFLPFCLTLSVSAKQLDSTTRVFFAYLMSAKSRWQQGGGKAISANKVGLNSMQVGPLQLNLDEQRPLLSDSFCLWSPCGVQSWYQPFLHYVSTWITVKTVRLRTVLVASLHQPGAKNLRTWVLRKLVGSKRAAVQSQQIGPSIKLK